MFRMMFGLSCNWCIIVVLMTLGCILSHVFLLHGMSVLCRFYYSLCGVSYVTYIVPVL